MMRLLPPINLVRTKGLAILQQLHLEERLLRTTSHNWCIINDGTDARTIVMGVSGQPEKLLEVHPVLRDRIPVIKRFSGGGTVIVDSDTVFVTLICNRGSIPNLQLFPRPIMSWTEQLYAPVFKGVAETGVADFHLLEHGQSVGKQVLNVLDLESAQAGNQQLRALLGPGAVLWDIEACPVPEEDCPDKEPGNMTMALECILRHCHNVLSLWRFNDISQRLKAVKRLQ